MGYGVHAAEALLERRGAHGRAAASMCARASISLPSAQARGRYRWMSRMPSSATPPSASGWNSRRTEGLEAVNEGIDAGGGGHRTRQPDGQFRVGYDDARHHLWVENNLFLMSLFVENDAGPADFRAGARGSRHTTVRRARCRRGPPEIHQSPMSSKSHSGRSLPRHEGHDLACRRRAPIRRRRPRRHRDRPRGRRAIPPRHGSKPDFP